MGRKGCVTISVLKIGSCYCITLLSFKAFLLQMNFNKIKHYLFRERFFDIVFGTYYRVTHRVITNPRISKPYLCKRHVQFNHRKSHEPRSGEKLMYNKTIILLIWLFFLFTIEHDKFDLWTGGKSKSNWYLG